MKSDLPRIVASHYPDRGGFSFSAARYMIDSRSQLPTAMQRDSKNAGVGTR